MRRIRSFALVWLLAGSGAAHARRRAAGAGVGARPPRAEAQQAQGRYADSLKTLARAEAARGRQGCAGRAGRDPRAMGTPTLRSGRPPPRASTSQGARPRARRRGGSARAALLTTSEISTPRNTNTRMPRAPTARPLRSAEKAGDRAHGRGARTRIAPRLCSAAVRWLPTCARRSPGRPRSRRAAGIAANADVMISAGRTMRVSASSTAKSCAPGESAEIGVRVPSYALG